jgi:hypothetical protein
MRICLHSRLPAWTRATNGGLGLPSCVTPSLNKCSQYWNLYQLSIAYAIRLGLGPDLPWEDEPSPGNLRFSAGRILTCLIVYSYRHSHLNTVHHSLRYSFNPYSTLPYRLCVYLNLSAASGNRMPGPYALFTIPTLLLLTNLITHTIPKLRWYA